MGRRKIGWIAIVAILSAAGCLQESRPALRVGTSIWPGYEPMYLAQSLGSYDPKQIQVIDFPSAVEVTRAYRNGAIDVAALTADEALSVAATDPDTNKIILIADFSSGADCILMQPHYTKFAQLKDLRVGVESNALGGYVLMRALELHSMRIGDIRPVTMSQDEHVLAFEEERIDAVVTAEPMCSRLSASGASVVFTSKEIPGEVVDTIVTRVEFVKTRREALLHFTRGWFDAIDYMKREPQAAAERIAIHERISPEAFLAASQGLELLDRAGNLRLLNSGGISKSLTSLSQTMLSHGLVQAPVDVSNLFDASMIEQSGQ
jgi:NitT/TauT family transport system substrate-binding protein